jgi:hypothetical protein
MEVFTALGEHFLRPIDRKTTVNLMWGSNYLDRNDTSFWNATYKGEVVYDQEFTLNFHKSENQLFVI